ncbi:uncharacterized protein G2W53_024296 [Senna tora]|uniref:Uncharacterized protein n=1 Tax=Senna tora TaxID=362788 RepID=A0A834WGT8_9FABA|nr:uncharacterized protein G2W53_024296 [Senna tora]
MTKLISHPAVNSSVIGVGLTLIIEGSRGTIILNRNFQIEALGFYIYPGSGVEPRRIIVSFHSDLQRKGDPPSVSLLGHCIHRRLRRESSHCRLTGRDRVGGSTFQAVLERRPGIYPETPYPYPCPFAFAFGAEEGTHMALARAAQVGSPLEDRTSSAAAHIAIHIHLNGTQTMRDGDWRVVVVEEVEEAAAAAAVVMVSLPLETIILWVWSLVMIRSCWTLKPFLGSLSQGFQERETKKQG